MEKLLGFVLDGSKQVSRMSFQLAVRAVLVCFWLWGSMQSIEMETIWVMEELLRECWWVYSQFIDGSCLHILAKDWASDPRGTAVCGFPVASFRRFTVGK